MKEKQDLCLIKFQLKNVDQRTGSSNGCNMQDSSNQKLLLAPNISPMSNPPMSLSSWKRKIKETFENEFCKQKFKYLIKIWFIKA